MQQEGVYEQKSGYSSKRPSLITIICTIGFIGVPLTIILMFIPSVLFLMIKEYGVLFIPVTLGSSVLSLIGLIGYWKMKRWGLYVYGFTTVMSILISLSIGIAFNYGYVIPFLITLIGIFYAKDMR